MTARLNTSMFLAPSLQIALSHLWYTLSSDGLAPYKAIEQLSYLLTLKLMERYNEESCPRWSTICVVPKENLWSVVSEAMVWLREESDFPLFGGAHLSISESSLKEVIVLIDEVFLTTSSGEQHAHCYEALLSMAEDAARAWASPGGKFYTPPHLAHLLSSLVSPQPGERICDYSCGNGRLLAAVYEQIVRTWCDSDTVAYTFDGQPLLLETFPWTVQQRTLLDRTQLVGMDIDEHAALQSWVRMYCLGMERPEIHAVDTLSNHLWECLPDKQEGLFDILLANPPYSSAIDEETLDESLRTHKASKPELLFVYRALELLRPGGRAAIIVPDSILFHQSKAAIELRRTLVTKHCLHAIISLPAGIFAPYTDVKTSILVLTRFARTTTIWCYDVKHDGYTLDKRRQPTPEYNDFPDLMIHYSLHFADTLSTCRSAFITSDTALQWANIERHSHASHYAQPLVIEQRFAGTLAMPIIQAKSGEISLNQFDAQYILLPSRYQLCETTQPDTSAYYQESLKVLRWLHRTRQITARQHIKSLCFLDEPREELVRRYYRVCTPFPRLW